MISSLAVVAAVNDEPVLQSNLGSSPIVNEEGFPLIVEQGYLSAGKAYNAGMSHSSAEIVVFSHQDVYFPEDWLRSLKRALVWLKEHDPYWGVLGCFGVTPAGHHVGHVYSSGMRRILGKSFSVPEEVRTLDEVVLILRKSSGLRFNDELPFFHFYGTDICMSAQAGNLNCYAIPAFCIHNSNPVIQLPKEFCTAYRYIKRRWRESLPIETTCITVSRWDSELRKRRLQDLIRKVAGRRSDGAGGRVRDPVKLWKEIQSSLSVKILQEKKSGGSFPENLFIL